MLFNQNKTNKIKIYSRSLALANTYRSRSKVEIHQNIKFNSQAILLLAFPQKLYDFFNLWPLNQWVWSIAGLVFLYWVATGLYNKRLKYKYDIKMSVSFRIYLIFSDLILNLIIGLYYMNYRDTVLGQLTLSCPIFLSPLIFIIELVLVILWYEIYKKTR